MGQTLSKNRIRWAVASDLEAILEIENDCFDEPWSTEDFLSLKQQLNSVLLVSEIEGDDGHVITGFMAHELVGNRFHIHNLAVLPEYQRERIGEGFVSYLMRQLSEKRQNIVTECRESNLFAQLFFKHCDFDCKAILKNYYDNGENAYRFRYNLYGKDE